MKKATTEKLGHSLRLAGVDEESAQTISASLKIPGQAELLIDWMERHKNAGPRSICDMAHEISLIKTPEGINEGRDRLLDMSISTLALLADIDRVTDWEKVRRDLDEMFGPDWRKGNLKG